MNPGEAGRPEMGTMTADPTYATNPGALTAPPPEAFNKVYPVCTRTLQDNCRNRGGV